MKKTTFFNIVIFVCFALNFSYANTLHVSNSRDNILGNVSETFPYKSITRAASMVISDIVLVNGEPKI